MTCCAAGVQALGVNAYGLLWLRYSGFLALYPIGVSSELTMVWLALHAIRTRGLLSLTLPNAANFAFDYYIVCVIGMLVYLPGDSPPDTATQGNLNGTVLRDKKRPATTVSRSPAPGLEGVQGIRC